MCVCVCVCVSNRERARERESERRCAACLCVGVGESKNGRLRGHKLVVSDVFQLKLKSLVQSVTNLAGKITIVRTMVKVTVRVMRRQG